MRAWRRRFTKDGVEGVGRIRPGRGASRGCRRDGGGAALTVATGEVITDCRRRHTAADVLRFFKLIDLQVARGRDIHVVLDNLSA